MNTIIKGDDSSGALFSLSMRYRFRLWRVWNHDLPRACFIMLNPSTADEIKNDPTVERCHRRTLAWTRRGLRSFGGVEVVNVYALRSTDPAGLWQVADPAGEGNEGHILAACHTAEDRGGIVVCGWGSNAKQAHVDPLLVKLRDAEIDLHAFKLNADGNPTHPLYLAYDLLPRPWYEYDGSLAPAEAV